ncbi:MAG: hypothetical protein GF398_18925 [Chitinivibrionales bacterium]|nr:hypothetical protein [Chitinivibrionales bacterium]
MKNIVAPIDFSRVTERILLISSQLAHAFGSKVWLIHVVSPEPYPADYSAGPQSVRDNAAEKLKSAHQDLQNQSRRLKEMGIAATALLVKGDVVDEITRHAKKVNADLVVMGEYGHSEVRDLIMGSAAKGMMKKHICPLLFLPADNSSDEA